jgi:uncharacterized protein
MIIPYKELSFQALDGIIESFVLREGTDYGEQEKSFEQKKTDVLNQIKSGRIVIVYSELHESINLMQADTFKGD